MKAPVGPVVSFDIAAIAVQSYRLCLKATLPVAYLWFERNEGMDAYRSPQMDFRNLELLLRNSKTSYYNKEARVFTHIYPCDGRVL